MTDPTKKTAEPMRGWVKFLLAVSLALNLLVFGAAGSAMYAFKTGGGPFGAHKMGSLPYTFALSRHDRTAISSDTRKEVQALHGDLVKPQQSYKALQQAVMAPVYDKMAVHKLLAEHQDAGLKRQAIAQRLFLERLDSMTTEQRQKFANRLGHILMHKR